MVKFRSDGRHCNELRPLKITYDAAGNADGSVLIELGKTRILCTVMIQDGVPPHLRKSGKGWLTAEYAMLPAATQERTQRESTTVMRRNGRSTEISRLIGRALRAVIDTSKMGGEKTIYIDCDVIQADGGTRTTAIIGAYCALRSVVRKKLLPESFLVDSVAAISVGWAADNQALLDVNYQEDSALQADYNFIMTGSGHIIELQGAAEQRAISWQAVQEMHKVAYAGIQEIFSLIDDAPQIPKAGFTIGMMQQKQI